MKFLGLILLISAFGITSFARTAEKEMGLDDIMDAYLLAKADVGTIELEPKNIEKEPYTVQVAAYLSEQDAIGHVKDLKKSQSDVYYFTSFARGQVWYKVCVGRFEDIKKAERFRKSFVKKMEEPFAVVIALKGNSTERKTASVEKDSTPLPIEKPKTAKADMNVAMLNKTDATEKEMVIGTVKDFLYAIQVGSFPSKTEAQKKADSLKTVEKAYVKSAMVNGKTWYRVLVGNFETKSEADSYKASYKEQTKDSGAFVKRLSK